MESQKPDKQRLRDSESLFYKKGENNHEKNEFIIYSYYCIFRENCASVPKERSAIPLETERSSAD